MGAPGSYYWTGTVKVLNLTDNTYYKLNDDAVIARRYTYLGKQLSVLAVRVDQLSFGYGFEYIFSVNSTGFTCSKNQLMSQTYLN